MNFEKYQTVVFSTAHITEDDSLVLERLSQDNEMILSRDTGFFIKLFTEDNDVSNYSEALQNLITIAVDNDFTMIELDSDGKIYDELPKFGW